MATGSIYCDLAMRHSGFIGESVTDSSVLVVKTHRLDTWMVMQPAVYIIRNPARAIVSYWNFRSTHSHRKDQPPIMFGVCVCVCVCVRTAQCVVCHCACMTTLSEPYFFIATFLWYSTYMYICIYHMNSRLGDNMAVWMMMTHDQLVEHQPRILVVVGLNPVK